VPVWIVKLLPFIKRLAWKRLLRVAFWLYTAGRRRLARNLKNGEREELTSLLMRSKGRPSNISAPERTRVRELINKALTGKFPA
jgi:hypothetical protein